MRRLTDEYCRFLAWNAAQQPPLPVCRKCGMPYHVRDGGEFLAGRCFTCEANWLFTIVRRAVRVLGVRATMRRLKAMARRRPRQLAAQGGERC
jgi:hypothetical protein